MNEWRFPQPIMLANIGCGAMTAARHQPSSLAHHKSPQDWWREKLVRGKRLDMKRYIQHQLPKIFPSACTATVTQSASSRQHVQPHHYSIRAHSLRTLAWPATMTLKYRWPLCGWQRHAGACLHSVTRLLAEGPVHPLSLHSLI